MIRKAFTLRIGPGERAALKDLSAIEGRPLNQLINEAIKNYLKQGGKKERSLEANLVRLREYRKRPDGFERAAAALVEAEATLPDPVEGKLMKGKFVKGRFKPEGQLQRRMRKLLDA